MTIYKYDLHIHTSEVSGCGKIKSKDIVKMYKDIGYDGLVITDHYYEGFFENIKDSSWNKKAEDFLIGYRTAHEEAQKLNLKIFLGMELRFSGSENDYLVYGIDENFLLNNPELYKLSLEKFKELIKDKEIVIYQAHPFRTNCFSVDPQLLNGVEVYNGNQRANSYNNQSYESAKKNNLLMVSGSDFHEKEDLATGGIITNERINDNKELVKILKNTN